MSAGALFVAVLSVTAVRPCGDESRPRIGRIEIVSHEIFDEDDSFWPYRWANRLHFRTRESIIRQELLFRSGDSLDREALAQTERNLRALIVFRDARVEIFPSEKGGSGNGTVDIRVVTFDAWSTVPELRFARIGNKLVWAMGASERNLLGRGKQIEVSRRSGLEREETFFFFQDPRLGGSRFRAVTSFSTRADGRQALISLSRPFFSLGTAWAFGFRGEGFDQLDPLYAEGERVAELRHVRRWGEVELARAIHRAPTRAVRFHLAYRRLEDEVAGDLRRFGILQVGLSSVQHRFLKLTHVNRFERVEDFNLGNEASAFVGVSTSALGGEEGATWFCALSNRRGFRLGREHFLLGTVSWRARRRRGRPENSLLVARLDYLNKLSPRSVVVATAELKRGARLDPEVQLSLGAESGLRGYPVHQWVGNRSLYLSAETRWFLADEVAQLASFALAAFADAGFAWPEGQSMDLRDLRADMGFGLLIGRNRLAATGPGVRLDLAYALHPLPGRSRWLLSVGSRIGF